MTRSRSNSVFNASCLMLALLLIRTSEGIGGIISADRVIDWTPGLNVGVPGGIPNRTTIGKNAVTDYGADPTGATDSTSAIQSTISNTPSGQVAYIPAGTYKVSGPLSPKANVTVRGAGMGTTILMCYNPGDNGVIENSGNSLSSPTITVTSGATKGSTSVTVDTTSGIGVNKPILISGLNPSFVHYIPDIYGTPTYMGYGPDRLLNCTHYVTSISGTTVNFSPPLPIDMSADSPMITPYSIILPGFGVENITFDLTNSSVGGAVFLSQAYGCWLKGVEVYHTSSRQVWFYRMVNSEIRECYFHDTNGTGPNHEGVDLALSDCFNLIEDNICVTAGKPAIILGDYGGGCSGNVIGYNYIYTTNAGSTILEPSISVNHGPHNVMNLIEGNVCQSVKSDGYFGSSSHNTFLRNFISGNYPSTVSWPCAVQMNKWSDYMNFVGNVLGYSGSSQVYTTTTSAYSTTTNVIWLLGFPNAGNSGYVAWPPDPATMSNPVNGEYTNPTINGQTNTAHNGPFDTNVSATILRGGNYDYVTKSTVWDSTITDHTIPSSYYYSSQPSWWTTGLPWPPTGSDLVPMVGQIPAEMRFQGLLNPPSNLQVLPAG